MPEEVATQDRLGEQLQLHQQDEQLRKRALDARHVISGGRGHVGEVAWT